MPAFTDLQKEKAEITENLLYLQEQYSKYYNTNKNKFSLCDLALYADILKKIEALLAVFQNEAFTPETLKKFFHNHWEDIKKGIVLPYTVIPAYENFKILLINLVELLSKEDNNNLSINELNLSYHVNPLEILMPGLSLKSLSNDYPDLESKIIQIPDKAKIELLNTKVDDDNSNTIILYENKVYFFNPLTLKVECIDDPDWYNQINNQNICAFYNYNGYTSTYTLTDILNTHIVSENFKFLLPVKQITEIPLIGEITPLINIYDGDGSKWSEKQFNHIKAHSSMTEKILDIKESYQKKLKESHILYDQLITLHNHLYENSNQMLGSEKDAGNGVYAYIKNFYLYYTELTPEDRNKIPLKVKYEIHKILDYAGARYYDLVAYKDDDSMNLFTIYITLHSEDKTKFDYKIKGLNGTEEGIIYTKDLSLVCSKEQLSISDIQEVKDEVLKIVIQNKHALVFDGAKDAIDTCLNTRRTELNSVTTENKKELSEIGTAQIENNLKEKYETEFHNSVKNVKNSIDNKKYIGSDSAVYTMKLISSLSIKISVTSEEEWDKFVTIDASEIDDFLKNDDELRKQVVSYINNHDTFITKLIIQTPGPKIDIILKHIANSLTEIHDIGVNQLINIFTFIKDKSIYLIKYIDILSCIKSEPTFLKDIMENQTEQVQSQIINYLLAINDEMINLYMVILSPYMDENLANNYKNNVLTLVNKVEGKIKYSLNYNSKLTKFIICILHSVKTIKEDEKNILIEKCWNLVQCPIDFYNCIKKIPENYVAQFLENAQVNIEKIFPKYLGINAPNPEHFNMNMRFVLTGFSHGKILEFFLKNKDHIYSTVPDKAGIYCKEFLQILIEFNLLSDEILVDLKRLNFKITLGDVNHIIGAQGRTDAYKNLTNFVINNISTTTEFKLWFEYACDNNATDKTFITVLSSPTIYNLLTQDKENSKSLSTLCTMIKKLPESVLEVILPFYKNAITRASDINTLLNIEGIDQGKQDVIVQKMQGISPAISEVIDFKVFLKVPSKVINIIYMESDFFRLAYNMFATESTVDNSKSSKIETSKYISNLLCFKIPNKIKDTIIELIRTDKDIENLIKICLISNNKTEQEIKKAILDALKDKGKEGIWKQKIHADKLKLLQNKDTTIAYKVTIFNQISSKLKIKTENPSELEDIKQIAVYLLPLIIGNAIENLKLPINLDSENLLSEGETQKACDNLLKEVSDITKNITDLYDDDLELFKTEKIKKLKDELDKAIDTKKQSITKMTNAINAINKIKNDLRNIASNFAASNSITKIKEDKEIIIKQLASYEQQLNNAYEILGLAIPDNIAREFNEKKDSINENSKQKMQLIKGRIKEIINEKTKNVNEFEYTFKTCETIVAVKNCAQDIDNAINNMQSSLLADDLIKNNITEVILLQEYEGFNNAYRSKQVQIATDRAAQIDKIENPPFKKAFCQTYGKKKTYRDSLTKYFGWTPENISSWKKIYYFWIWYCRDNPGYCYIYT